MLMIMRERETSNRRMLKGKLGSLHLEGEQVGGILDWEVTPLVNEFAQAGDLIHKVVKWKLTAPSYWLFATTDSVSIKLYLEGKGYLEGTGIITSNTQKLMDTLIHEEITILGEGILEGKE